MERITLTAEEWEIIEEPLFLWINDYLRKYCNSYPSRTDVDYINAHKEKFIALQAFLKGRMGAELEERRRVV